MRKSFALQFAGSIGLVASAIAVVVVLNRYDDGLRLLSTDPFVKRLPSIRYELRHESTGEMYRGHLLDRDGLVRKIRVQFKDGQFGIKYVTPNGVLVGAKEFLKDGSYIVYDIESDGKTSNHQQWFSKDNVLLADRRIGSDKSVKVTTFASDGATPTAIEETANGTTSKVFMYASGKPKAKFKMESDNAVQFEVLSEAGARLYSESISAGEYMDECGPSQDVEVVVYGDGGKVSLKQYYRIDPHSGGGATLVKVEQYSADGKSVTRLVEVSGDDATVTTTGADGTKTVTTTKLAEAPKELVGEPSHPAKDVEPKLAESFTFPLRALNMLN